MIQSYIAIQQLSEAASVGSFNVQQLQSLSTLHTTYALTFNVVAIFLALGSTLFNFLFYRSGYIPKLLAAWGIFSALLLLVSEFILLIFPSTDSIFPAVFGPIALDEIILGCWLLFRGVKISE